MKKYYCCESQKTYTEVELMKFYEADKSGYESFTTWLNGSLRVNNGTLTPLPRV